MNTAQKIAVGTWAAAAIAVTFLHNPTEGWDGTNRVPQPQETPLWNNTIAECKQSSLQKWYDSEPMAELAKLQATGNATTADFDALRKRTLARHKLTALCFSWDRTYYAAEARPISEWYSERAFLPILRDVSSFLWAQFCLAAFAIVAFVLTRQVADGTSTAKSSIQASSIDQDQ